MTDNALGDIDVLLGGTDDEMTAFFAFNPSVQVLGRDDILDVRLLRSGGAASARRIYQRYAAEHPGANYRPRKSALGLCGLQ